ncbi:N-acetyltransferase [Paecilomyces variotii No. 5]|uniref:N-acetyltransferase n=1 Tax=Byssochlamys spectabilis (strain No. 5 / NBRC 109023) TaxID=1356009 RepID=V5FFR4_BYSSN|nr:N-acetyltransferase [Paecilomyces variotii No. 5]
MLINANTAVSTSSVLLVPYSKCHVPKYHEWMKDPEIQEATASEPLTLEEEYSMQQSWRNDADKLTFIVCSPLSQSNREEHERACGTSHLSEQDDAPEKMVGDINLFLRVDDGEEGDLEPQIIGEVELMIAEKDNQRKGFGRASLLSFIKYVVNHETEILEEFLHSEPDSLAKIKKPWKFSCLSVKVGQTNDRSLALFESLLFQKVTAEPNYFGEFELRRTALDPGSIDASLTKFGINGFTEVHYR